MTPAAAATAVEQQIATQWALGPNTPIAYPNVLFTPPETGSWLKLDWLWGNGATVTKGSSGVGRSQVVGVLQLAVFAPRDTGDGPLDTIAESARAILHRLRLPSPNEDVSFGVPSGPVKRDEESWRSLVISTAFRVFDTVP